MAITDLIDIPRNINQGVSSAKQRTVISLLGRPCNTPNNNDCKPIDTRRLRPLVETADVGPFRVTGLFPAVESLRDVMTSIANREAEVFAALGSAGMLCCRFVRCSRSGCPSSFSNHAFGMAIDLKLNGRLDIRGDTKVQLGLSKIAPIFNEHGWFWGAGFRTEDAMHFEVADETIRRWHAEGKFDHPGPLPDPALSIGDRGPEVRRLQERLNELDGGLIVDGIFGPVTHAAVMAFQAENHPPLAVDGIVGPNTRTALGL